MKKTLILITAFVNSILAFSQFSTAGSQSIGVAQNNIDTVFVLKSTTADTLLFQQTGTYNYKWYQYDLGGNLNLLSESTDTDTTSIVLQNKKSSGYKLETDGQRDRWIWIFDYSQLNSQLDSIEVFSDVNDRCDFIQLNLGIQAEPLVYDTVGHSLINFEIDRQFEITYDSTYYASQNYATEQVTRIIPQTINYSIESPLANTDYTLSGDLFAKEFGIINEVSSQEFEAIAVEVNTEATVRVRDADNEMEKDESTDRKLIGSAPLNIEVMNYASPASFYFDWCVSSFSDFSSCSINSSQKDFRYVFEEQGTYYLRLRVSNSSPSEDPSKNCMYEKTFIIEVLESALDIPNVFSPNGDGINDEFKVAFKSIIDFRMRIYNVWGKQVYQTTDASQGWDGYIGSAQAAAGVYFYVIEATGNDIDSEGNRIKYYKKGDINLLR